MRATTDNIWLDFGYEDYTVKDDVSTWSRQCRNCEVGIHLRTNLNQGFAPELFRDEEWRWDILSEVMDRYCDERCSCGVGSYVK